jgi:hypothetical protein
MQPLRLGESREGDTMLLEKERERLLQVLMSRTATHAEKRRASEMLEQDLSPEGAREFAGASDADTRPARSDQNVTSPPAPSELTRRS